ncbi:hypothetical protein EGT07_21050 [Herbaspirillum sp. HC18]|nr:hypothetical protein EGT07_21050 [Herbaspirillum sp. HC18]
MRRANHLSIAIAVGIIVLVLEVAVAVRAMGGWHGVLEVVRALATRSTGGVLLVGEGIIAGVAGAVTAALIVYMGLGGFSKERNKLHLGPIVGLSTLVTFVLFPLIALDSSPSKYNERLRQLNDEKARAEAFVVADENVIKVAGSPVSASVFSYSFDGSKDDMPTRYDVFIKGTAALFAAVYPDRTKKPTHFSIRCVSFKAHAGREPNGNECLP